MQASPTVLWMPGGVRTEIHLGAADTGGAFCLLLDHPPPGWSLPPHRHRAESETIHVLEGEFEMTLEGETRGLRAGETLHVQAGAVHSGRNTGASTGRRLLLFSPAGMERFFIEAGSTEPGVPPDPAAALAAARRHGWEFPPAGG